MTARAEYPKIQTQIEKRLRNVSQPVTFNSGELADSLALEHLTGAAQFFVPFFGNQENGYLFMLTKSDNVDDILDLPHNGHTIISWSLNAPTISRSFEIGAPTIKRRLVAAQKVQEAGYRLRLRLDPILPFKGWQEAYSQTIQDVFAVLDPERITLGTLRFEKGFFGMRDSIFSTGEKLRQFADPMKPMFPPMYIEGRQQPLTGKYSYSLGERIVIFKFVTDEIRRHSDCPIALCKESSDVISAVGLDPNHIECVCQS
jgi:spore photoproduct lyase